MQRKVSDLIAEFLKEKQIKHVFGIIGAGNAHIFDSIYTLGYTEIICVHHEQAACMAMQTYYRTSGSLTAALLTTGGGSTNGVTGVVSAWADSIPGIIISGNENSKYIDLHKDVRMWGVQGYDSLHMVEKVTKHNERVLDANDTINILDNAFAVSTHGRPGPCWIDIPMDIQAAKIEVESIIEKTSKLKTLDLLNDVELDIKINEIVELLKISKRPLFWLGNGIRLSGGVSQVEDLINKFNIPTIVSWAGIDLVDSNHPLVFGRAGTYGQRCANFILQNCDLLVCIGTRLAISQIGYDISEIARDAKIAFVDIDKNEIDKLGSKIDLKINADAKDFITVMIDQSHKINKEVYSGWIERCNYFKNKYPWVNENDHPDVDGFINSYTFMEKLNSHLKDKQIITTDMGTALLSGHQVLRISKGQRLMTSTGLGEMGYGLPAAIGASFALNKSPVICIEGDGSLQMNIQELQTLVHHKLPVVMVVINNDGYISIKITQQNFFGGYEVASGKESGVSFPSLEKLSDAYGIEYHKITRNSEIDNVLFDIFSSDISGPIICEVFTHPNEKHEPKVIHKGIDKDGKIIPGDLTNMFISETFDN